MARLNGNVTDHCKCMPSLSANLDYHSPIGIDAAQEEYFTETVEPKHGLTSEPYYFDFESMEDVYLNMGSMTMSVIFDITKADGSSIEGLDVGFTNLALSSMFSRIDTYCNDIQICPESSNGIPYAAYLETILSYEKPDKQAVQAAGFSKDYAFVFEHMKSVGGFRNGGFKYRADLCRGSKPVKISGSICSPFLRSDRHLAPGNKLTLVFYKSSPQFFIETKAENVDLQFNIKHMSIECRRLKLVPELNAKLLHPSDHQRYLSSGFEVKEVSIPTGSQHLDITLQTQSALPKQVIAVFPKQASRSGLFSQNAFNFRHDYISRVHLNINNEITPADSFCPDFENSIYGREYYNLFLASGKIKNNKKGLSFKFREYGGGYCINMWDLTPDQCNSAHVHQGRKGDMDIHVEWAKPLEFPKTMIVLCLYDLVVTIDPVSGVPTSTLF